MLNFDSVVNVHHVNVICSVPAIRFAIRLADHHVTHDVAIPQNDG